MFSVQLSANEGRWIGVETQWRGSFQPNISNWPEPNWDFTTLSSQVPTLAAWFPSLLPHTPVASVSTATDSPYLIRRLPTRLLRYHLPYLLRRHSFLCRRLYHHHLATFPVHPTSLAVRPYAHIVFRLLAYLSFPSHLDRPASSAFLANAYHWIGRGCGNKSKNLGTAAVQHHQVQHCHHHHYLQRHHQHNFRYPRPKQWPQSPPPHWQWQHRRPPHCWRSRLTTGAFSH